MGQSPTEVASVEETNNGSLDADLDIPRVHLDLMNDLKDVIFTKLSLNDNVESSITDSLSSFEKDGPPINRSVSLV